MVGMFLGGSRSSNRHPRGAFITVNRIPSLDGLRAVAISMVIVGHAVFAYTKEEPWLVAQYTYAGVLIFFVLSGYLITTLMLQQRTVDIAGFYLRRAWRILPVVYAYLIVITILRHDQFSRWDIVLSWTFLASVGQSFPGFPWDLSHLWSLSVEEMFYFLWPLLLVAGYAKPAAWAAVVLAPIARFFMNKHGLDHAAWFSFPATMDSIAIGSLMALYAGRLQHLRSSWLGLSWLIVPAAPALITLAGYTHWLWPLPQLLGHLAFTLLNIGTGFGILWAIASKPRILNNPVTAWIGGISYSLYIWHMMFFNPQGEVAFPLNVLFAFAAAAASFYLLEQPILSWRKRRASSPLHHDTENHTHKPADQLLP